MKKRTFVITTLIAISSINLIIAPDTYASEKSPFAKAIAAQQKLAKAAKAGVQRLEEAAKAGVQGLEEAKAGVQGLEEAQAEAQRVKEATEIAKAAAEQAMNQACQSAPSAVASNIKSWNDIAANGESIIEQTEKLASNVNGIVKIEEELTQMDKDLISSKRVFDLFTPLVSTVASIKNLFKLGSSTFNTLRTKGIVPAKDFSTTVSTKSGLKKAQEQLEENVTDNMEEGVKIAEQNSVELTEKLSQLETTCAVIRAASCAANLSLDELNELSRATQPALLAINLATSAQTEYLNAGQKLNSSLKKANDALVFTVDFSKQIKEINGPIKDITGTVNGLGKIMDKKITIHIELPIVADFKESFKLKDAFKAVGSIIKTISNIPGVGDVIKEVNKPIEAAMSEVTKPVTTLLKPLTKGIKVPSVDLKAISIGEIPKFEPKGLPNPADIISPLQSLLTACVP